jgi:hypothetical protein
LERKAAKERKKDSGKIHGRGKPAIGPEKFSGPIKGTVVDRASNAICLSRPTLIKIEAITEAAKRNPKRYHPLVNEMDCVLKQLGRMKEEEEGFIPAEFSLHYPEWIWPVAFHGLHKSMNSTGDICGIERLVISWFA